MFKFQVLFIIFNTIYVNSYIITRMNCCICGKPLKRLSSKINCSENHYYHKSCINSSIKGLTIHQMISHCKSCISSLLSSQKPTGNCIKCKKPFKKEFQCLSFKHLNHYCEDCDLEFLNVKVYRDCSNIQKKHKNLTIRFCLYCDGVFKSEDLLFSHKCNHNICKNCSENFEKINCNYCLNYLEKEAFLIKNFCHSCRNQNLTDKDLRCLQGHGYCYECIINNFEIGNDCKDCLVSKKLIQEDKHARNSFKNQKNIIFNKNNPKDPIISPLTSLFNCIKCRGRFEKVYKIPTCDAHDYCKTCIQQKGNNEHFCKFCAGYFQIIDSIESSDIFCNLCQSLSVLKSKFCSNGHLYCKTCEDSLKSGKEILYPRVLNCEMCKYKLFINQKALSSNLSNSPYFAIVSNKNLTKPCETTNDHTSQVTYNCDHSFCHDCLYKNYSQRAYEFAENIHKINLNQISQKFVVKCLKSDCENIIRIPYKKIRIQLKDKNQYFLYKILKNFELYLDGVKCFFYICNCTNVVGRIQNKKFNCKCVISS